LGESWSKVGLNKNCKAQDYSSSTTKKKNSKENNDNSTKILNKSYEVVILKHDNNLGENYIKF
jgi:hypothetical protein